MVMNHCEAYMAWSTPIAACGRAVVEKKTKWK